MSQGLRKPLTRVVTIMFGLIILAFVTILLNGSLIFSSESSESDEVNDFFAGLVVGEPELRRVDGRLAWVTYLSPQQIEHLNSFTSAVVNLNSGCDIKQQYCLLEANTHKNGINIQYTLAAPAQLPSDLPWLGGFVNPINGVVYDLLGRNYWFQGEVDSIPLIQVQRD